MKNSLIADISNGLCGYDAEPIWDIEKAEKNTVDGNTQIWLTVKKVGEDTVYKQECRSLFYRLFSCDSLECFEISTLSKDFEKGVWHIHLSENKEQKNETDE